MLRKEQPIKKSNYQKAQEEIEDLIHLIEELSTAIDCQVQITSQHVQETKNGGEATTLINKQNYLPLDIYKVRTILTDRVRELQEVPYTEG